VSTQPPLVLERARRLLAPPAAVGLTLSGDTLVISGQASRRWRDRATMIAPTLPGVASVNLSEMADQVPAAIATLRREATARQILFAVGSARIDAAGRAAVDTIAAALVRLRQAAAAEGYWVSVELAGRTDATGSEATNFDLARRRAEVVRAALIGAGAPMTEIGVKPLGFSDPLRSDDPTLAARINRSVALELTVTDDSAVPASRQGSGVQ
jgi:outer membrane protein OmpA-like peptidoglycan-associated protein